MLNQAGQNVYEIGYICRRRCQNLRSRMGVQPPTTMFAKELLSNDGSQCTFKFFISVWRNIKPKMRFQQHTIRKLTDKQSYSIEQSWNLYDHSWRITGVTGIYTHPHSRKPTTIKHRVHLQFTLSSSLFHGTQAKSTSMIRKKCSLAQHNWRVSRNNGMWKRSTTHKKSSRLQNNAISASWQTY